MNAIEFAETFSHNLRFKQKDDDVYFLDDYHLGDPDYDYGIIDRISKDDFLKGKFDIGSIPDFYINGHFEWLLDDDLPHHYGISQNTIHRLSGADYSDWDLIIKREEEAVPHDLREICQILREDEPLEGITPIQFQMFVPPADNFEIEAIENYEQDLYERE